MNNPLPIRLILIALALYLSTLGATFNGVLGLPELQPVTLGAFGAAVAAWGVWHWRTRRTWHRSALDGVFILWGAAFLLSTVTNMETWRRSAEALWYMLLYVAIWYVISDLVAQGVQRAVFAEALLLSGVIILPMGYWHLITLINLGEYPATRPGSLIGNPNALGAYLVVLLPFALAWAIWAKAQLARYALRLYALLIFGLLLATYSRGAWVGMAASLVIFGLLVLYEANLRSPAQMRAWLAQQSVWRRRFILAAGTLLLLGALGGGAFFLRSFSQGGREASFRVYLWQAGATLFTEKPLTGYGLFTYGHYLPRFDAIPPGQPHSHAHNIPLTIAAELGIVGVAALIITVGVALMHIYRNLKILPAREKPIWLASVAAMFGWGMHHLLDTPAMMPLIALMGLVALALATAPAQPVRLQATWRQRGHPVAMLLMWVVLLGLGFWNSQTYQAYYATLATALKPETPQASDYRTGAEALDAIIATDPYQPAYVLQQAYLYGLAANAGDTEAALLGSAAYDRYLALEPYHSSAWANRAALDWQAGNPADAITAIEEALKLAPTWADALRQHAIYTGELVNAPDKAPDESPWGENWAQFQYLRFVISGEYLPQVGDG